MSCWQVASPLICWVRVLDTGPVGEGAWTLASKTIKDNIQLLLWGQTNLESNNRNKRILFWYLPTQSNSIECCSDLLCRNKYLHLASLHQEFLQIQQSRTSYRYTEPEKSLNWIGCTTKEDWIVSFWWILSHQKIFKWFKEEIQHWPGDECLGFTPWFSSHFIAMVVKIIPVQVSGVSEHLAVCCLVPGALWNSCLCGA